MTFSIWGGFYALMMLKSSFFVLPSILLSTALCRSGFCRASRFLSSLAQTMKAFMGLRILWSAPPVFPSTVPARSGLPELDVREILGSDLLMFPDRLASGELSPERFGSKSISGSEAGLGVPEAHGPPRGTWLRCNRVSRGQLDSVKFIPELVLSPNCA